MNNSIVLWKINNNLKKPINEQLRDSKFLGAHVITTSGTFTPPKSGYYKIILVGRGGSAYNSSSAPSYTGSGGGVSIMTKLLSSESTYTISIGSSVVFDNFSAIAYSAQNSNSSIGVGAVGTAEGGDFNYNGLPGDVVSVANRVNSYLGGDVGVYIPELAERLTALRSKSGDFYEAQSGIGICGFGAGEGLFYGVESGKKNTGAAIIIPLELTEE